MTFKQISSFSALLFATLGVLLFAMPSVIFWMFELQQHELGDFLARRAALLFLGLTVLCFLARNSQHHEVQRIVSVSMCVSMGAMAMLGAYEALRGYAGPGIWGAIFVEVCVSALFFRAWRQTSQEPTA